jgi:hypothetical protein
MILWVEVTHFILLVRMVPIIYNGRLCVANSFVGTAPDASYYLFITDRTSENPVEESLGLKLPRSIDRVDIITSSLGYFEFDNRAYDHTYAQMDGKTAFISESRNCFSRGMIVVVSAGNQGNSSNSIYCCSSRCCQSLSISSSKKV